VRPRNKASFLALIQLLDGPQGYSTGVCSVASNAKRKKIKEVLGTSNNSQRLFRRKFYSQYEDLKSHKKITKSGATFDKLLVLLGPSLTLQDTRMRKAVPEEERLAVTQT
jgi:hypothetical protein